MEFPKIVSDLTPAEYNPRTITTEALEGLKNSLSNLGDISGIVYNIQTKNLICAHQRKKNIPPETPIIIDTQEQGKNGTVAWGHIDFEGERFPIRIVDWPLEKEKVANMTANNPHLRGDFIPSAEDLLKDIKEFNPEDYGDFRLDKLLEDINTIYDNQEHGLGGGGSESTSTNATKTGKIIYRVIMETATQEEQYKIYEELKDKYPCKMDFITE